MENSRTEAARDTDDSALIEGTESGMSAGSASGGNLARDVSTHAELAQVAEPEPGSRVQKSDAIEHGTEVRPDRARASDS